MEEGEVVEDAPPAPVLGRDGQELEDGEIEEGEILDEFAALPLQNTPLLRRKQSRNEPWSEEDGDDYWSDGDVRHRRSRSWSRSPVHVSVRLRKKRRSKSPHPYLAEWQQRASLELREFVNDLADTESLLKGVPESSIAECAPAKPV
jgi:hypothetical protein